MNTLHWENKDLALFTSGNELTVIKKNRFKRNQIFLLLLLPTFLTLIIYLLSKYTDIRLTDTTLSYVLAIVIAMYLIAVYINTLKQTVFNLKDLNIKVENSHIYINGRLFCEKKNIDTIIIQPSYGTDGLGMSYTIGVKTKTKAKPIIHFLGEKESEFIAKLLSEFLSIEFATRKPLLFRSLSKW
jgi:hypothetical protein